MKEETVTGIILQSIPYQDSHRILTVYTFEEGILKFFANWAGKMNFLRPLNKVEILFRRGKKDFDYYIEGRFIKSFAEGDLQQLTAASEMARAILASQEVEKASSKLYVLFEAFLTALPFIRNPNTLLLSFHLKHLLHEGFFSFNTQCAECKNPLNDAFYYSGEPFCKFHAEPNSLHFSEEEFKMLLLLGLSRSITELDDIEPSRTLSLKVQSLMNAKGGT